MDEYGPLMDDKHDDLPTKNADLPIYYNVLMQSISKESQQNLNSHSPDLHVKVTALSAEDISRHRKKLTRHPTQLRRTSREKKVLHPADRCCSCLLGSLDFQKKQKASCLKNN